MGTITLTNIPQFVESVGRDITKTAGSLDRMTVPFIGPYGAQIPFRKGSPDTVYPLMFCTGWSQRNNGGLVELTVNYAGRTDIPSGNFVSEYLVTYSASEKELSYSELAIDTILITFTSPSAIAPSGKSATYRASIQNYVLRYITTQVTYKYCSYPQAVTMDMISTVQPKVSSQYTRYAGSSSGSYFTTVEAIAGQYPGPYGYTGPILREVNFSAEQAIDNWYQCSVTYDARYESV